MASKKVSKKNAGESELGEVLPMGKDKPTGAVARIIGRKISRSGPLPTPADLMKYNQALPGLANRIVQMAEKEQSARHRMMKDAVRLSEESIRHEDRKINRSTLVVCLLIIGTATTAVYGVYWVAGFMAVGSIAGVVTRFIDSVFANRKNASRRKKKNR